MFDFFTRLFDPSGFVPRRACGDWTPGLVWLHNASDALIWLAYFAIPLVLLVIARRRKDVPFRGVYFLFVAFILTCGFTHFLEVVMFYSPLYRLSGLVKAVTAVASWATVIALVPVVPKVLAMRSPEALEREIAERHRVEGELRALHAQLEERVGQRTAELERAVTTLTGEVEERKRLEREVWESREQLRLMTDNTPVMLVHCDTERRYKFVNRGYAECVRLTPLDVVGRTIPEVVGERAYERLRAQVDAALSGERVEVEVESPYEGAEKRWLHYTFSPHRSDSGAVLGFLVAIIDVTERRNADNLLHTIMDTVPALISYLDTGGHYRLNNRAYEEWFDHPRSAMAGRDVRDVLGESAWAVIGPRFEAALAGQTVRYEAQVPFKDGGMRWIDATYSPHLDAEGSVAGVVALVNDITDRKKAETALRESEARKSAILETALDCIIIIDHHDRIIEFNPAAERTFGYGRADVLGKSLAELIVPPSLREKHRRGIKHFLATGEGPVLNRRIENVAVRADGTEFTVELAVTPMTLDGSPIFTAYLRDITDRIRADKALRESEARFRHLADAMPQIVWAAKPDGYTDYFNERWFEYTGLPREYDGEEGWTPTLHPDDLQSTTDAWHAAVHSGQRYEIEHRFRNGTTGEYRWHMGRAVPVRDDAGGIVRWFGTSTDIHDKKLAEEELRGLNATLEHRVAERTAEVGQRAKELRDQARLLESILGSVAEGVVVANEEGKFLLFNPAAERMLGGGATNSPVAEWSQTYGVFLLDGQTEFPSHQLPLARAIRGEPTDDVEMIIRNPNQPIGAVLSVTGRPLYSDGGRVGGGVVVLHNITARKRAEEQTTASLREKEVLLKEIHHRVKNNLQIVSTLLDLQSGHTSDPAALAMFQETRGRVKSMALIHERLYRSQDMARVDFAEYVRQLADDLCRTYRVSEGIRLELDVDIPPITIDIAIPCGLLLNELISNCFKHAFADAAEGCLRVTLHRDGGANVLTVADDGSGFPADTDFRSTTSFGLQLVNTLVDQLDGEITLTTDRGTTFTVRFPKPASSSPTGTFP